LRIDSEPTVSELQFLATKFQDISDEDEAKSKAKIADALGVDWTQLMKSSKDDAIGSAAQVTSINKSMV
jgi:hypothetical protein